MSVFDFFDVVPHSAPSWQFVAIWCTSTFSTIPLAPRQRLRARNRMSNVL
jgi:hypothetical protein